jgi:hypothetical protein
LRIKNREESSFKIQWGLAIRQDQTAYFGGKIEFYSVLNADQTMSLEMALIVAVGI